MSTSFEVGKIYHITHSRKGKIALQVTSQDETWVTGIITAGVANAILDYNVKIQGEEITLRKTHCDQVVLSGVK